MVQSISVAEWQKDWPHALSFMSGSDIRVWADVARVWIPAEFWLMAPGELLVTHLIRCAPRKTAPFSTVALFSGCNGVSNYGFTFHFLNDLNAKFLFVCVSGHLYILFVKISNKSLHLFKKWVIWVLCKVSLYILSTNKLFYFLFKKDLLTYFMHVSALFAWMPIW